MNVSKKIIIKTVSFFLITEIISLFFIFFLVYPFMGRNFFKLIDEFKVPIVISVVVYIIVCYSLYLLIKPISKLKRSENNKNNEDTKLNIIKIEKIVKIFFTTVNIIGWVVVSSIATISRALLEGFTRWSTVRFILVCFIFGPVIGIIQSLYFSYLMRDVKIDVNIIEFNIKESFFNVKRKIFYNFAVLLLFITLVTTLVTFASIEKTAGISNIAYQLDKNKSEEPEGYFTTLLKKIENTTNLTEIKEEASIIKEQWMEKSKYDTVGIIIFVFIVFSLTLAAAYIFASYIYTHLKGINDRLKEISKVEGDITQFLVKTTDDEIGGIQVNINRLLLNLNKNFKTIYDVATTIINKNKEEESSIENLIKLNNEISSISKILNSEIQNQKNVVTATAETIKETVQLLENNKENITSQAAMVEESNASHHQVLKSIELVANNIEEAHKLSTNLENISNNSLIAVSELKTSISDINSIGERISEILTTIFSITDQIDILAMNAAIEAAHAGDAGKGFAVVADEVRKLAENTSVQTQDISKLLKEMTESIKNSVSKSQNMALAFQNISTGVDETTKIINSINIASTELQAAAKENIKATDSLVKITADVMDNLTKEDEFNTKLNETIKQLDLSTENFNNVGQRQADYFINLEKQFENFNVYFKNISEKLKLLESILNKLKLLEENVLSS